MKPELEAAVIAFYNAFYGPTADLDGGWEAESDARKDHFRKCYWTSLRAIPLSRELIHATLDPVGPRNVVVAVIDYLTEDS